MRISNGSMSTKAVRRRGPYAKVQERHARMRAAFAKGATIAELAAEFQTSQMTVRRVVGDALRQRRASRDEAIRGLKGLGFSQSSIARVVGLTPAGICLALQRMQARAAQAVGA